MMSADQKDLPELVQLLIDGQLDSMATPRSNHTATLLPSGKVLVAGGGNGGCCTNVLASAELYEPIAGTWSLTGSSMTAARFQQTATLLPNGNVLVAGGCSVGCVPELASGELYDPTGVPGPSCGLTGSGTDASGHTFIHITVHDTTSGLRLVKATESNNASVAVPTFTVGTTSLQVVVATKIDQTKTAQVAFQVTNVAGQVTNCDPVLTEVGRDGPAVHRASRRFTTWHKAKVR